MWLWCWKKQNALQTLDGCIWGQETRVYWNFKGTISELKSWLLGSDVEQAWNDYQKIKEKEDDLKKQIALEKKKIMKKLQKAMLDI